jgi:hypothetical protein
MSDRIGRQAAGAPEVGSALVVTVLMLVLLGVLGLAALDTVTRDQQVAGFQNRNRLAFYTAEAGVADGKDRLRAVYSPDATVSFPTQAAPVEVGDAQLFPYGQPRYFADPTAPAGVQYMSQGAIDLSSGMDLREGGEQWFNTLWRVQVQGQTSDGANSRIDVMATRQLTGGTAY